MEVAKQKIDWGHVIYHASYMIGLILIGLLGMYITGKVT